MSQSITAATALTQPASHPRWRSIEWTLPLLICALLLVVMAVFAALTYAALRHESIRAAEARTDNVAQQLASLLDVSMQRTLSDARQAVSGDADRLKQLKDGLKNLGLDG